MRDHEVCLKKAYSDLYSSKILLEAEAFDTSIYHTQQCAEKAIKGYLSSREQFIPKTHNLEYLIKKCMCFDKEFWCLMDAVSELNPYASRFRYPDDLHEPEVDDARQAVILAQRVFDFSKKKIKEVVSGQKNIFLNL